VKETLPSSSLCTKKRNYEGMSSHQFTKKIRNPNPKPDSFRHATSRLANPTFENVGPEIDYCTESSSVDESIAQFRKTMMMVTMFAPLLYAVEQYVSQSLARSVDLRPCWGLLTAVEAKECSARPSCPSRAIRDPIIFIS
jgi:hypothetical protein